MKKIMVLSGMLSILALASCNNKNEEDNSSPPPPPSPPVEQTAPPAATEQKEGTTIKMNEEGVSYESKDGAKESKVKISKDTTSIELSRPK